MGKDNEEPENGVAVDDGRQFPLSNDVVFEFVMRDPEIAKEVVETALGLEVDHVVRHETQNVLSGSAFGKRIRLDVYLEADGACFDVEMQTSPSKYLGLRLRAYQSLIDASTLWSGDDFDKLKRSYIIFFCTHDPLKEGLWKYTVKPTCTEAPRARLSTRQTWTLFNAQAWMQATEGIRSLLELIDKGACDETGRTPLTCKLEEAVTRANADPDVREEAMISLEKKREMEVLYEVEERYDKGHADGKAEGEAKMAELVKRLLADGRTEELAKAAGDAELREKLMAEYGIE